MANLWSRLHSRAAKSSGFNLLWAGAGPTVKEGDWLGWPCNGIYTGQAGLINSPDQSWEGTRAFMPWGNRGNVSTTQFNCRPNVVSPAISAANFPQPRTECRTEYSTRALGKAATLFHIRASLAFYEGQDLAVAAASYGFDPSKIYRNGGTEPAFAQFPDITDETVKQSVFTNEPTSPSNNSDTLYYVARDILILPVQIIRQRLDMVVVDYEVGDGTTESETIDFCDKLAALCKPVGCKTGLMHNPVYNNSGKQSGLTTASVSHAMDVLDTMWPQVYSGPYTGPYDLANTLQQIEQYMRNARANMSKLGLFLDISVGNTSGTYGDVFTSSYGFTPGHMQYVASWAKSRGIKTLCLWRNGVLGLSDSTVDPVDRNLAALVGYLQ